METIKNLSFVIVNYRTPGLVIKCVKSILEFAISVPHNIIVVDNLSPDDSYVVLCNELTQLGVRVLASPNNDGYAFGVNFGAKAVETDNFVILNPDTYFTDRSIVKAIDLLLADSQVGLVGLDLVYPDGTRQYSARTFYTWLDIFGRRSKLGQLPFFKQRIDRHMMKQSWVNERAFDADWVMGTGMIVRSDLYHKLQGMDQRYFLYMEDVDLCIRIWRSGYRVVCLPKAVLVHDHQRSSNSGVLSRAGKMHLKSLKLFMKQYKIPLFFPAKHHNICK